MHERAKTAKKTKMKKKIKGKKVGRIDKRLKRPIKLNRLKRLTKNRL